MESRRAGLGNSFWNRGFSLGLLFGLGLLGGCASVLGIEAVSLDEGQGGQGGQGGDGGMGGGQGGAAGMACVPKSCMELGKNCGDVDDGCNGTASCGDCPFGQVCGFGGVAGVCGGTVQVRNGYVLSDGSQAFSQTCEQTANGSVDCDPAKYMLTGFTLKPAALTLDAGTHLSDRFGSAFSRGSKQWYLNGYLQSDGKKEWTQICDFPEGGVLQCDDVQHPFTMTPLPSPGLPLDPGTTVAGRYTYVYRANGVLLMRNGYVQSDGLKTHSQDCTIDAAGAIDCDPMTHTFKSYTLPPAGYPLTPGTIVSDRFVYVHGLAGALKLHNGYVQSDGLKEFFQECDLPDSGVLNCDPATHPVLTVDLPPPISPAPAVAITHRYAFDYVK